MPKRTRGGNREKARKERKLNLQREQIRKEGYNPTKPRILSDRTGKQFLDPVYVKKLIKPARWSYKYQDLDEELHNIAVEISRELDFPDNISECSTIILEPHRVQELRDIYKELLYVTEIERVNTDGIIEVTIV